MAGPVPGYYLERLLGRGATGEVWQARAGKAGPVAVKCIDLEAMTPQERRMAEQEAQLLRRIRHPHIVRFLDLVLSGDRMHLVMELMEGDLQQAIQTRREPPLRRFAEAVLWKWLAQLSGALAFLHQAQIIHRDVKPANVFLSKESVVLGDFGIAKVASFASTQIGTPGYLAPEVWLGRRYGPKSDIFSLGCSCFEASALRPAFEGPTAEVSRPCPRLEGSEAWRGAVRAMLQKQPQRRPGASEVLSLARPHLRGRPNSNSPSPAARGMQLGKRGPRRGKECQPQDPIPRRCGASPGSPRWTEDQHAGDWGDICPWRDRVEVSAWDLREVSEDSSLFELSITDSLPPGDEDLPAVEIRPSTRTLLKEVLLDPEVLASAF